MLSWYQCYQVTHLGEAHDFNEVEGHPLALVYGDRPCEPERELQPLALLLLWVAALVAARV